jgi:hypothetical protein
MIAAGPVDPGIALAVFLELDYPDAETVRATLAGLRAASASDTY